MISHQEGVGLEVWPILRADRTGSHSRVHLRAGIVISPPP